MRRLWAAYSEALRVRPLRTNVASAGAIMFVGDSAAQQIELRRDGALAHCQDFGRTATMTSWNALFFAPFFFYWFRFLDARWPTPHDLEWLLRGKRVLKKVVVNHACSVAPLNAAFFVYSATLEHALSSAGEPGDAGTLWVKVVEKFRHNFVAVIIGSFSWWMPINTLNFMFCAPHMRILVTSVASIVWNTYLSLVSHRKRSDKNR
eukprot:gnl/TRDRNA2_/TRDRNA2_49872_c0_seq2.p1 gnl/TRDRNA2_/TRDRNA2_49872_c0~~gnl/TRDRNA2_/TRDRNA2_49872_c0_seq2.p1  ORF type:complete len:206 (-),score=22.70 gnl/TRDRNA2_/TRDRNA2_49872_c0_seq2:96-713(-)